MDDKKYWVPGETLRQLVQFALDNSAEFDEDLAVVHLGLDLADGQEKKPERYAALWGWSTEAFEQRFSSVRDRAVQANAAKVYRDQLS